MLRVGLTGGLATGKTHVAATLKDLGCYVLHADEVGHQVLLPGGEAYDDVVREFGKGILDETGLIVRARLATQVFGRPDRLGVLNNLVHPAVFQREEAWIRELAASDPHAIAVWEAAILIETGRHRRFQKLILTVCTEEQQYERAMARGLTREEVAARLAHQMPLAEKIPLVDYVIDTSGSRENTKEQTRVVYDALRRLTG